MTKIHSSSNDPSVQYRTEDPKHNTSKPDAPAHKADPNDIQNPPSRGAAPPDPAFTPPKPDPDDIKNPPINEEPFRDPTGVVPWGEFSQIPVPPIPRPSLDPI